MQALLVAVGFTFSLLSLLRGQKGQVSVLGLLLLSIAMGETHLLPPSNEWDLIYLKLVSV